jgi:hypothetical protein
MTAAAAATTGPTTTGVLVRGTFFSGTSWGCRPEEPPAAGLGEQGAYV